jgi:ubiquinone biosynthesis protein
LIEGFGPVYIKFGQLLSVRFDLLPQAACFELQKLLDDEKPLPFELIKARIKTELGERYARHIKVIYPDPIGVASLGQVHKAQLKDGSIVAIKVRKPGIEKLIEHDVATIKNVIRVACLSDYFRRISLKETFDEFASWISKEVDYTIEAANIDKFRDSFKNDPNVYVPKVYLNLSTEKILTTEYIEGITVKEALNILTRDGPEALYIKNHKTRFTTRFLKAELFMATHTHQM